MGRRKNKSSVDVQDTAQMLPALVKVFEIPFNLIKDMTEEQIKEKYSHLIEAGHQLQIVIS